LEEKQNNFLLAKALAAAAKDKFAKNIVGIYAVESKRKNKNQEKPDLEGTGFLVRAKSKVFVFTAKHVLDIRHHLGRGALAIAPGRSGQHLIKLMLQETVYTCSGDRDDVAIVELLSRHEEELSKYKEIEPTHVSNLFPNFEVKENGAVLMIGFPGEMTERIIDRKNKPGVSSTGIPYLSILTQKPVLNKKARYNRERDMLMVFDKENSVNELDTPILPPDPLGISGGPLIALLARNIIWTPDELKIIGVCRKWFEAENCICATRIEVALELAKKKWPEEF